MKCSRCDDDTPISMTKLATPTEARFNLAPVRQLTAVEEGPLRPGETRETTTNAAEASAGWMVASVERKAALAAQIATLVAQGRRVEYQGQFDAVLVRGQRPSHGLDRLPTSITGLFGAEKRERVTVDKFGKVTVRNK